MKSPHLSQFQSPWWSFLWSWKFWFSVSAEVGGLILLYSQVQWNPESPWQDKAGICSGSVLVLAGGLFAAASQVLDKQRTQTRARIEEFLDALATLLEIGTSAKYFPELKLRLCVHCVDDTVYRQVTDYCGSPNARDGNNRQFQRGRGIVGAAIHSGEEAVADLPPHQTNVDFLSANHLFTREEAVKSRKDRQSWFAIPVKTAANGEVEVVLYCDSNHRGFFGNKQSPRRKLLQAAVPCILSILIATCPEGSNGQA